MINETLLKAVWKKVDDLVDWVKITGKPLLGNALELTDNILGPAGLKYLNEKFGGKIPEKLRDDVELALTAFINDDYEGILAALPTGLDSIIDIKFMEDDLEAAWIGANFNALVAFIKFYAEKMKKQK